MEAFPEQKIQLRFQTAFSNGTQLVLPVSMHVMEMAELGNTIENCFFQEFLNQFDQLIKVFTFK